MDARCSFPPVAAACLGPRPSVGASSLLLGIPTHLSGSGWPRTGPGASPSSTDRQPDPQAVSSASGVSRQRGTVPTLRKLGEGLKTKWARRHLDYLLVTCPGSSPASGSDFLPGAPSGEPSVSWPSPGWELGLWDVWIQRWELGAETGGLGGVGTAVLSVTMAGPRRCHRYLVAPPCPSLLPGCGQVGLPGPPP